MSATQPPADAVHQRHRDEAVVLSMKSWEVEGGFQQVAAQAFAAFEATLRPAIIAEERAKVQALEAELAGVRSLVCDWITWLDCDSGDEDTPNAAEHEAGMLAKMRIIAKEIAA